MMRSPPRWLRSPALWAALCTAAFLAVALSCVRLQYMSNDDVTIMDFARQGFQVRYMGVLLTSLMHLGYVALPGLAWYGLTLYGLNALCLWLWLWLGFRVIRPWWLAATFVAVVFGFYLRHLAFLDYTATSAMLCTAAVAWACIMVLETGAARRFLLPGAVFMLGMMVRPHGVPGALLFTLPLWLTAALICLRQTSDAVTLRRLTVAALLFVLPAAAEFGLDLAYRAATVTPQQSEYETFNAVRGRIHRLSTPRKEALAKDVAALRAAGMHSTDVNDLYQWYFLDERVYTPQALATLLAHVPALQLSGAKWYASFHQRFNLHNVFLLLMLGAWPLLLLAWRGHGWAVLPGLLLPLWYPLLTSGMSLLFMFPARVEHPFVAATGIACFLLTARFALPEDGKPSLAWRGCAVLMVAVTLLATLHNLRGEAAHYGGMARRAARVRQNLAAIDRDFPGSVILIQPQWGLPLEMLDPLRPVDLRFQPVQLGWSTFSPRFYRQIEALGINHGYELRDALLDRDKVYVLAGQPGWMRFLVLDTRASGCKARAVPVEKFRDGVGVYRLERGACTAKP